MPGHYVSGEKCSHCYRERKQLFTQFNVWRDVWAQGNEVKKGGRGEAEERAHLCKRGLGGSHQCVKILMGVE